MLASIPRLRCIVEPASDVRYSSRGRPEAGVSASTISRAEPSGSPSMMMISSGGGTHASRLSITLRRASGRLKVGITTEKLVIG